MAEAPDDRDNGAERQEDDEHPALRPDSLERAQDSPELDETVRVIQETVGRLVRRELRQEIQVVRRELHIGPLPHERTLEAYERIVPGSAAMIFREFEEQGRHRRQLESFALKSGTVRSFGGLIFGFIIALAFLYVAYDLTRDGHEVAGTIIGAVDLVGLVAVFVYGSHVLRDERIRKAKIMTGQDADKDDDKS